MDIRQLDVYTLQEMMGDASEREARCMLAIMSRECVVDTDDLSSADWVRYLWQAVAQAAREAE